MPIFIGNWDKQDGTPVLRVYVVAIDMANKTVAALVDTQKNSRKIVFDIPAAQITWDHWANG